MAGYTIIADVGSALVKILRENMVPDVISNADAIGLCSPSDKGDFVLGLYLYDIKESEDVFENGMRIAGKNQQQYPSKYLNLYYMLTAYSMSDVKFRSVEEQRILGRAFQVFMDHGNLDGELQAVSAGNTGGKYSIRVELLRLDNDEKMKLWNMPDVPYKLSLYYKVSPIEIESTRVRNVQRVTSVEMEVSQKED